MKKAKRYKYFSVWQPKLRDKSQTVLRSFDNFARLDAASAYFHPTVTPGRELNAHRLQVRIKATTGFVVRV